jgi:hypothetical protein
MSDSRRGRPTHSRGNRQRRNLIEQSDSPSNSSEQTDSSSIADLDLNLESFSSIDPDPSLESRLTDHARMSYSTKHYEIGEPNKL